MPHQVVTDQPVQIVASLPTPDPVSDVNLPNAAYRRMEGKWPLLHDLLGGTEAMRAAGVKWLPREPKEEPGDYDLRLKRSVLHNATKNTVDRLVSKPFSRPITVLGDLSSAFQPMLKNIDKVGSDLTTFFKEVFRAGIQYGLTHVLVDYPKMKPEATLADEIENEIRPIFVRIDPPDLLGWKVRRTESGSLRLVQIRFREIREIDSGGFGSVEKEYIRVYNAPELGVEDGDGVIRGTWELHSKDEKGNWVLDSTGFHTFPGVPLTTFYVNRASFMEGYPPLEDLMWLNVRHWQVSSDVGNNLRMVLSAIFYVWGASEEELKTMTFGPNSFMRSERGPDQVECGFAEHTGSGIKSGREEIEHLEEQMEILGMQPLIQRTASSTATGKIIDESRVASDVQAWVRVLEAFIEECFRIADQWVDGVNVPTDFTVDVFNEFGIALRAGEDLGLLLKLRSAGALSLGTLLKEFKRRGVLSDYVDVDDETQAVLDEMVLPESDTDIEDETDSDTVTDPEDVDE